MEIRSKLRQLNRKDVKKIRSILQKWNSPQAVSNLLLYPFLIPEDIRGSCLLKGLREKKNSYYVLASIVGLQGIDPTSFSEDERNEIKESLIFTLKTSGGIISARGSVSICDYLSSEDASTMFELLDHPNDTTRHNILCWLIRAMEERGSDAFVLMARSSDENSSVPVRMRAACSDAFVSMARSSGMPEDVRKEAIEKFQEYLRQKEAGEVSSFSMQLYAYIPNLRDFI
ncbi:hypothetical protein [Methanosarcina sp. 1.H.A.2.2]|uniref:hypothetical protein n=1 Tax=Methanosarcina sp. 1.H.A.2.2 TaxID=1483601 RepID=UPI001F26CF4E|nr:hypothetical protein [Methanosarcina sp. 1.H.A.2.2]